MALFDPKKAWCGNVRKVLPGAISSSQQDEQKGWGSLSAHAPVVSHCVAAKQSAANLALPNLKAATAFSAASCPA